MQKRKMGCWHLFFFWCVATQSLNAFELEELQYTVVHIIILDQVNLKREIKWTRERASCCVGMASEFCYSHFMMLSTESQEIFWNCQ